jgi:hypothetical protein
MRAFLGPEFFGTARNVMGKVREILEPFEALEAPKRLPAAGSEGN